MPEDKKQAFELLKDCAENYPFFAVMIKNQHQMITLLSEPFNREYKVEVIPEIHNINIRQFGNTGCRIYLLFPDGYELKITDYGSHITFGFCKDELDEVEITFFRDFHKAVEGGLKGVAGSKYCE